MTVPPRLSLVTVGAHDIAALRAFYEHLGWESNTPPGDFAAFPLGGAVFSIYDLATLAGEVGLQAPANPERFNGYTLSINVDEETQVAAAIEAARAAGAKILAEPVKREWGGVSAYFADPEGNVWEVAWLPGAEFDDRGALIWPY